MALFKAKGRCLDDKEHKWLYVLLTELYLIRPRYASAFLSVFAEDLAEQMPKVVSAGIHVHTKHHGPTQLTDDETKHVLTLTCAIVAVYKWRQLSAYKSTFPPDAEKAIWCVLFMCGGVTNEVAPDVLQKVQSGITSMLGNDHTLYFEDPAVIENERLWDQARADVAERYNCGEIDESEFASEALDILESCPYASQQY